MIEYLPLDHLVRVEAAEEDAVHEQGVDEGEEAGGRGVELDEERGVAQHRGVRPPDVVRDGLQHGARH